MVAVRLGDIARRGQLPWLRPCFVVGISPVGPPLERNKRGAPLCPSQTHTDLTTSTSSSSWPIRGLFVPRRRRHRDRRRCCSSALMVPPSVYISLLLLFFTLSPIMSLVLFTSPYASNHLSLFYFPTTSQWIILISHFADEPSQTANNSHQLFLIQVPGLLRII